MSRGQVEFENVTCIQETAHALLCIIDDEEVWVPQSQVTEDSEVYRKGDEGKLVVREWWATEKGLI